jgi:hypothetical protein
MDCITKDIEKEVVNWVIPLLKEDCNSPEMLYLKMAQYIKGISVNLIRANLIGAVFNETLGLEMKAYDASDNKKEVLVAMRKGFIESVKLGRKRLYVTGKYKN